MSYMNYFDKTWIIGGGGYSLVDLDDSSSLGGTASRGTYFDLDDNSLLGIESIDLQVLSDLTLTRRNTFWILLLI